MDERYEFSFPAWGADGKRLYFCRAEKTARLKDFKYDLYSIDFDSRNATFGTVKPVYGFKASGLSVSMPQADPNGRYILATTLLLGSFPSQNQGDLHLIDLWTGKARHANALNSPDGEKYHHWSSNGRWVVFGSKRMNGGLSHIYIAFRPPGTVLDAFYLAAARRQLLSEEHAFLPLSDLEPERLLTFARKLGKSRERTGAGTRHGLLQETPPSRSKDARSGTLIPFPAPPAVRKTGNTGSVHPYMTERKGSRSMFHLTLARGAKPAENVSQSVVL